MTPELQQLGDAITRLKDSRSACDRQGLGVDIRRVGAAASIFHLRCTAVRSYRIDLQPIAWEGAAEQLSAVKNAVSQLISKQEITPAIRGLISDIAELSERALKSIVPAQ